MKKIMITFAVLMSVVLVGCGNNTYQSEIDEAVKVLQKEGYTDINRDSISANVYNDGSFIIINNGVYDRYVEKDENGKYVEANSVKIEKELKKSNTVEVYSEKNGKEIKK